MLTVKIGDRSVNVVVDGDRSVNVVADSDRPANGSGTIELSQASAAALGMTPNTKDIQCQVRMLLLENHPKLKQLMSAIPIISGFVFLCFIYNAGILSVLM